MSIPGSSRGGLLPEERLASSDGQVSLNTMIKDSSKDVVELTIGVNASRGCPVSLHSHY